jgi:hypothetical protein
LPRDLAEALRATERALVYDGVDARVPARRDE